MPSGRLDAVVDYLRRVSAPEAGGAPADDLLLERFAAHRDEAAFAALVERHGPLVWSVCRRMLGEVHDAEDAFQATFLVLVRKARSISKRASVRSWLYGVAHRVAGRARTTSAQRSSRERRAARAAHVAPDQEADRHEVRAILDEEVNRLPEQQRLPVILCYLEGKTNDEAAQQLGCPRGTIATQLARARERLRHRLARRGLAFSPAALVTVLFQETATAAVPAALAGATIRAASVRVGQAVGEISARASALTEGVCKAMTMTKLKMAAAVVLAAGVLATGATLFTHQVQAEKPADKPAKEKSKNTGKLETISLSGMVHAVDAAQNTITIGPSKQFLGLKTFAVAKDAKIFIDDGTADRLGFTEGKLADLAKGAVVTLRLSAGQKTVVRMLVEGPSVQGILKAVDADKHTITVKMVVSKGEAAVDKTFTLAEGGRVTIDDGKARKKHQEDKLADVTAGALVTLKLSGDLKKVGSIRAEGRTVQGVVKAVDANKPSLTLSLWEGKERRERRFTVARDAKVWMDTGRQDKFSLQPGKLADLPAGALATLRLSLDQKAVVAIHAEGPTLDGVLKAVDAKKNTITLTIAAKGQPAEEKTVKVPKGARVTRDEGTKAALADLPTEAHVRVKLAADLKTAVSVEAQGPGVSGVVKGNAGNDSITIGNKVGQETYSVPKVTKVLIDDQKEGKLADLIDGTIVSGKLSADKKEVIGILHAEGPSFRGLVKAVDADKSITLTIGGKNGVGGEDKTFTMTKATQVVTAINGVPLKLSDLRADKEVVLRLTIDQKVAGKITVLGE